MNIRTRLLSGFLLVALLVAALGVFVTIFNVKIRTGVNVILLSNIEEVKGSTGVAYSVQRIKSNIREFLLESIHQENQEEIRHATDVIQTGITELERNIAAWQTAISVGTELAAGTQEEEEEEEEDRLFSELRVALDTFIQGVNVFLVMAEEKGPQAATEFFENKVEPISRQIQATAKNLEEATQQEMIDELGDILEQIRRNGTASIAVTATAFFLALVLGLLISSSISRPLKKLESASMEFGKGRLDTEIEVDSKDEIGQLATSFKKMAEDLKRTTASRDEMAREIDTRVQAEQALKESEQKYSTTLESIGDGVISTDDKGEVVFMNLVAEALTGWKLEEAKGKDTREVFHIVKEETGKEAESPVVRVLREGIIVGLANHTILIKKDGTKVPIDDSGAPIRDKKGNLIGVVLVFRDIRERKQAAEQIEASLAEKEVLLQEVHHRVKNNLQVMGSLIRMQASNTENQEVAASLNDAQSRIASMALSHRILYESKDFSKLNLHEFTKNLVKTLFQTYSPGEQVRVVEDIPDISLPLDTATPLGLVLNELLANALKYAFPEGREGLIEISARQAEPGLVSIVVRDNGIGFPETLDPDHCETLGLQLVSSIVQAQLDGTIEFKRDHGTEVRLEIPLKEAPVQTRPAEREQQVKETEYSGLKVMVVEDEVVTSMEIQNMIRNMGYEVARAVVSGEEAVQEFEKSPLDIVLMDIKLKGEMNGIQAAAIIKEKAAVPVIFLSAFLDKHMLEIAKLPGPIGFLHKPFLQSELKEEVEKFI